MAGYVSSYPTLWSVFDMFVLLGKRIPRQWSRQNDAEEGRERKKEENGLTLITPVPRSL